MTSLRFGLLILFCCGVTLPLAGQEGAGAFYGHFDGKDFEDKHDMEWWFHRNKEGAITLSVSIFEATPKVVKGKKIISKRVLGLGSGREFKVVGSSLEFTLEWSGSHMIKGPAGARYVAEVKENNLHVTWVAGDKKGETTAKDRSPKVAKKDDKKTPMATPEKVYLSTLLTDKGLPALKGKTVKQLGLIIVMGASSKAQFVDVNKDTKFFVVDGEEKKAFDQMTVVNDEEIHAAFKERHVTLERKGSVALTVTATAVKKKG